MPKEIVAVSLSLELAEKLRQLGGNRSANVEKILQQYFNRKPTQAEIAAAIAVLAKMAEEEATP
ncbi:MAG: type II toxin-antitoxin system CcdA family antitoxin [Parcubacteria group bacterium]|jgi:post-segregation antitoxin (ccd killing protein)